MSQAGKDAKKGEPDQALVDALKKLMITYGKYTTADPERKQPPHPAIESLIKSSIKVR